MRENFTHGTHAKRLEADIRNSRVLSRPRIASAASRRDVALVRVVIRPLRRARHVAKCFHYASVIDGRPPSAETGSRL